jgi:hypothetical protein
MDLEFARVICSPKAEALIGGVQEGLGWAKATGGSAGVGSGRGAGKGFTEATVPAVGQVRWKGKGRRDGSGGGCEGGRVSDF